MELSQPLLEMDIGTEDEAARPAAGTTASPDLHVHFSAGEKRAAEASDQALKQERRYWSMASNSSAGEGDHLTLEERRTRVQYAAVCIVHALKGQRLVFRRNARGVYFVYHLHRKLSWLFQAAMIVNVGVSFFEPPLYCFHEDSCGPYDRPEFVYFGLPMILEQWSLAIELLCIFPLMLHVAMELYFRGLSHLPTTLRLIARVILLVVSFIDIWVAIFVMTGVIPRTSGALGNIRIAPFCRPILVAIWSVSIRHAYANLFKATPRILRILLIMTLIVIFFAYVGVIRFGSKVSEFSEPWSAFYTLYSILCLISSPDIPLLVVSKHYEAVIYWALYIAIEYYFVSNLFLAIVYEQYRNGIRYEAKVFLKNREAALTAAFAAADTQGRGWLSRRVTAILLSEASRYARQIPRLFSRYSYDIDRAELLADDETGRVQLAEFMGIIQVMHTREVKEAPLRCWCVHLCCPRFYGSTLHQHGISLLKHRLYTWFIVGSICVNTIVTVAQVHWMLLQERSPARVMTLWVCSGFFSILHPGDMMLQLVIFGWRKYWSSYSNRLDILTNIGSLTCWILMTLSLYTDLFKTDIYLRAVLIFNLFYSLRLLWRLPVFRESMATMYNLLSVFWVLFGLLFPIFSEFAYLGMYLFGGTIPRNDPIFKKMNIPPQFSSAVFNDFGQAMWAESMMLISGLGTLVRLYNKVMKTDWASLYFVVFYIFVVKVCATIIVSFVLDAYTFSANKKDASWSAVEVKEDENESDGEPREEYVDVVAPATTPIRVHSNLRVQRDHSVLYDLVLEEIQGPNSLSTSLDMSVPAMSWTGPSPDATSSYSRS